MWNNTGEKKKEKLGYKLLRNFFSPLKIEKYYLPTSSLLVIFKLKFLKLRKTSGSVEGATFSTFRIGNFQNEFPTIYDCGEKIKERREKREGKKIPYIKGNIADSIHSFFSPLPSSTAHTESLLVFNSSLDYVWPRLLRRLINVKLIGKHGWVPVLRANFRSSGSRPERRASQPREILGQNFRLSFNATSLYGESRNEFHFFRIN